MDKEGKLILELKVVLDHCTCDVRNRTIIEYHVKWKKMPPEEATWKMSTSCSNSLNHKALRANIFEGGYIYPSRLRWRSATSFSIPCLTRLGVIFIIFLGSCNILSLAYFGYGVMLGLLHERGLRP